MRLPSFSTLITLTRTCCPTETTSFGSLIRRRLISETCSNPSTPPRSMKAPKGVRVFTVPVSSAPGTITFLISSARAAACSFSSTARETTMRRPSSESSVTRNSNDWPMYASGFSILPSAICDSGQNARRPPMFTSKPPLFRAATFPSTGRRFSYI